MFDSSFFHFGDVYNDPFVIGIWNRGVFSFVLEWLNTWTLSVTRSVYDSTYTVVGTGHSWSSRDNCRGSVFRVGDEVWEVNVVEVTVVLFIHG